MHALSVAAIFKDEEDMIEEWIEHYLFHGADHFYLFNDESVDDTVLLLEPYIQRGVVTLITDSWPRYFGRQSDIYTHFFLPKLKETEWMLVLDVDEFMWSPVSIHLKGILDSCHHLAEIQVNQTLFGSNGHKSQPPKGSVVKSFTRRRYSQIGTSRTNGYKYFVNSAFSFKKLNVHFAEPLGEGETKCLVIHDDYFILNHYSCQSKEYFVEKKCRRTDADEFKTLTPEDFAEFDTNEVEDTRLRDQNRGIRPISA